MQYYLVNELLNCKLTEPAIPQITTQDGREKMNIAKGSEMIDIKEIKLLPCAYDKDSCYHDIFQIFNNIQCTYLNLGDANIKTAIKKMKGMTKETIFSLSFLYCHFIDFASGIGSLRVLEKHGILQQS